MPRLAPDDDVTAVASGEGPASRSILVCDDDAELRKLLSTLLSHRGYVVSTAVDAYDLERAMASGLSVDLIVLDMMMPGIDGHEACRRLRRLSAIPVLMLSALSDKHTRSVEMTVGADDYICKAFDPTELITRLEMLLYRARQSRGAQSASSRIVEFKGWHLDIGQRELRNPSGVIIDLSDGEHDVLVAFVEAPQHVFSHDQLMAAVRNRARFKDATRSIDAIVARLRRKLVSVDGGDCFIATEPDVGYTFVPRVHRC